MDPNLKLKNTQIQHDMFVSNQTHCDNSNFPLTFSQFKKIPIEMKVMANILEIGQSSKKSNL